MNSVLWTWQIRFPNTRVTTTCAISQKAGLDFIAIWRNVVACSKHFRHLLRLINWWTNLLRFNCDMFRQCFNSGGVGVSWGCITCSCHIKMTLLLSHQHQLNWVVGLSFLNLDCVTRHHPISHPPGFKAEKMNDNCSLTENRLLSLNHQTNIRLIHDVPRTIGQRVSGGRKSRLLLSLSLSHRARFSGHKRHHITDFDKQQLKQPGGAIRFIRFRTAFYSPKCVRIRWSILIEESGWGSSTIFVHPTTTATFNHYDFTITVAMG